MTTKTFQVRFATTAVGRDADQVRPLRAVWPRLFREHGPNLPTVELGGDHYQVRGLTRVGRMWRGAFSKLRDDAPHVVDARDAEHELELEEGDRILDKAFFLYYEDRNALIFQYSKNVGGLSTMENYLSRLLNDYVALPIVVDHDQLERVLQSGIYEVRFAYARPPGALQDGPRWEQSAFNMINSVGGAQGSFLMRAPRYGQLGGHVRDLVRWMVGSGQVRSAKVRLTDDSNPIDLFTFPVKDRIVVTMRGRYPSEHGSYEELAEAYERQVDRFP